MFSAGTRTDELADQVARSKTMTATTSSGNQYVLIGEPSEDWLDDPLVLAWLAIHDLTSRDVERGHR